MKKIGDIYINPMMGDLWILNKLWNEEKEKYVWTLNLIHYDLQEELENVRGFEKIGNIYDLIKENKKLKEEIYKSNAVADTNKELAESFHKENQKLKEQLQNKQDIINGILDYIDSNKFVEEFKNVVNERNVRNEILNRIEVINNE